MKFLLLLLCSVLIGCATPVGYSERPMQRVDKDTAFSIEESDNGFTITVYYSRYQFIPESDAVAMAGKSALLSQAYDVAEKRGKLIEIINEQRIKSSMGRNGLSGITSWTGSVPVTYKKSAQQGDAPEPASPTR